jgi:hypothetical protein
MISKQPSWTALDAGALPLPSGVPGDAGRVVAILATDGAVAAGWAGACAVALARAWASSRYRVVLADLDLHAPTLHRELGLANGEGLSDILLWGASVRRVARGVKDGGFYLVSAGTAVADVRSALASPRWAPLCDGFRNAGVTLAVFLPHSAPARDAVLRQASEVMIVAPETEDVASLLAATSRPVTGVVGRRGAPEAAPGPSAPAGPATEGTVAPEEERESVAEEQDVGFGDEAPPAMVGLQEAAAAEEPVAEEPATESEVGAEPEVSTEPEAGTGSQTGTEGKTATELRMADAAATPPEATDVDVPKPLAPVAPLLALAPQEHRQFLRGSAVEPKPALEVPPLERVRGDPGTGVARPTGRRRGLFLALLLLAVVLLGLLAAALLGYRPIPGIPVLTGGGAGSSASGMGAPSITSVAEPTTHFPAVVRHGARLPDRTGRLPA